MYYDLHTPTAAYRFTLYTTDSYFNRIAGIYIFLAIPRHAEPMVINQQPLTSNRLL